MRIYLKEKIGNPELFTGRKERLYSLLKWVHEIKKEISQSKALLSRRKTGKTALLQRLYNTVFEDNNGIIPFYYEMKEGSQWALEFCEDFFLTFIYQYIAFKTRKSEYIKLKEKSLDDALIVSKKENLDFLIGLINNVKNRIKNEQIDILWNIVRDAPREVAGYNNEYIVQIIDEFQYLNRKIYWDKGKTNPARDFVGGYLHTAEYKNAPLIVSGSWIGWLMDDLKTMLPGRFIMETLENIPEHEAIEMIYKYSYIQDEPVSEESVYLMAGLTEGNPFYISSLFRSPCPDRDLFTIKGVLRTLEFETLNTRGIINGTWMEYINSALPRVNDQNAKRMILYLSKERHREVSRKELMEKLVPDMSDDELSKKLDALVYSDIIEYGRSYFYFRGVPDNIFDKVFRSKYADDIRKFDPQEITNEYKALFNEIEEKYRSLSGKHNYYKGMYAEFIMINILMYKTYKNNTLYTSMMENLPEDFQFVEYKNVWSYKASPVHKRDVQIDLLARSKNNEDYTLIGEVKNRKDKKISKEEAQQFEEKAQSLIELEDIDKAVLFIFPLCGFTKDALSYMKENNIAWTEDRRWIDNYL